nr:hypothetical protein [Alphabaculovirus mabrassicae]
MRRNNRTNTVSVLNHDQLEQIVTRNQAFLRDFLLVICCVVVFIVVIMFIVLMLNINKSVEIVEARNRERQKTYVSNLDLRAREPARVIDLNKPIAVAAVPSTI